MNKFNGFTLAEVLITLVIIGVIAAMTIPSLIATQQKESYVAGAKKAYSILSQARMEVADDYAGDYSSLFTDTDETCGDVAFQAFAKHLNIAKNCGSGMGCLPRHKINLNGTNAAYDWDAGEDSGGGKGILADGMAIEFESDSNSCLDDWCGYVTVDINGAKDPNTRGRDIFLFFIKKNKIAPYGFLNSKADVDSDCSPTTGWGAQCATKVLREGAMNY